MKRIIYLASLAIFLMSCASTGINTYGVNVISQGEYERRIAPYTKKIETYNGLINTLHMSTTLINSAVADAQLQQKARLYQWDQNTLETEKSKSEEELSQTTQIFVSLYTPERKHDDLHKNETLWKMFLDSEGRRWEGKAKKIKLLATEVQALYPDHTRFATPYLIIFPVPIKSIEHQRLKLTITGAVAAASVQFEGSTVTNSP